MRRRKAPDGNRRAKGTGERPGGRSGNIRRRSARRRRSRDIRRDGSPGSSLLAANDDTVCPRARLGENGTGAVGATLHEFDPPVDPAGQKKVEAAGDLSPPFLLSTPLPMDDPNTQHGKGKVNELKGNIKQAVGDATDDNSMQAEGMGDEAKGKAQQAGAHIRKAIDDLTK